MSDSGQSTDVIERSTCATRGCQRTPVVVHSFAPGDEPLKSEKAELCLPCRRVIEFAKQIPWGDQSEEWDDKQALRKFRDGKYVSSERYLQTDTDRNGGGDDE
jgi:hypothetical protein